jgi:AcrR family transcriptional regulator
VAVPVAQRAAKARQTREETRRRIVEAATELFRTLPYAAVSVDEVMRRAGIGRTLFYRHFDDLPDLLMKAGREAIEELYTTHETLAHAAVTADPQVIRRGLEAAAAVYVRHGPLLRAIAEAATVDERIHEGQSAMRERFRELLEQTLTRLLPPGAPEAAELARALNVMNESYLLDVFGREPRVPPDVAARTLSHVIDAVLKP